MADGPCTGDASEDGSQQLKALRVNCSIVCEKLDANNRESGQKHCDSADDERVDRLSANEGTNAQLLHEEYMDMEITYCNEEDYRKKRCVDRYDSSESSDR